MEAKIVPYKPFGLNGPNYKVFARKVFLKIGKFVLRRWSLVADRYHYEDAKSVASTVALIEEVE